MKKAKYVSIGDLIKSVGTTVFVIGSAYTLLTLLVAGLLIAEGITIETRSLVYAAVLMIPLSVYWIIAGRSIKQSKNHPEKALRIIGQVTATAVIFTLLNVIETVLGGANAGVVIITAFSAYLYWSYRDLKSRLGEK